MTRAQYYTTYRIFRWIMNASSTRKSSHMPQELKDLTPLEIKLLRRDYLTARIVETTLRDKPLHKCFIPASAVKIRHKYF